jgi:uncharacterized protein
VAEPRWIADEMVGRLARYLRFTGYDTEYARGLSDDEILRRALAEDRVVLTRDRDLARRSPHALLLTSPSIADQWREVRSAYPDLALDPRFVRCTACNGRLEPVPPSGAPDRESRLPPAVRAGASPLFRCVRCGHLYWEGSHSRAVRERLRDWSRPAPAVGRTA